jgi:hypothetical protein
MEIGFMTFTGLQKLAVPGWQNVFPAAPLTGAIQVPIQVGSLQFKSNTGNISQSIYTVPVGLDADFMLHVNATCDVTGGTVAPFVTYTDDSGTSGASTTITGATVTCTTLGTSSSGSSKRRSSPAVLRSNRSPPGTEFDNPVQIRAECALIGLRWQCTSGDLWVI